MLGLAIAAGWVATGVIAVAVMRRRGHDTYSWALLFMFLGPVAVPLAISADRHRPAEPPRPLPASGLDVLVSHDGTPDAQAALATAIILLGQRMTSMTLAAVVDLEAPNTVRGRDTQREAQARLDTLAEELATMTSAPIGTVVLFGELASTLQNFAIENGYELIVAGGVAARAHLGGRRAARTHRSTPVLIGPTAP